RLQRAAVALADEKAQSAAGVAANEAARDSALAAASAASDHIDRELAIEEARLLAHLSELSSLRQSWVEREQAQLQKHRHLLQRYGVAEPGTVLAPDEAALRYSEVRTLLRELRDAASQSLDALDAPSRVKPLGVGFVLDGDALATHGPAAGRIRDLRVKVLTEEAALSVREAEFRFAQAREVMTALGTLQARRLTLLAALDPQRRSEAAGFTREGLDRVLGEVEHLRLMARWYPVQRLYEAQTVATLLRNALTAGRVGASLFGLFVVLAALAFSYRRSQQVLDRLGAWLLPRIGSRPLRRSVDRALQMLARIAPALLLLLGVYLLFDQLLVGRAGLPELDVLRSLAYAYALYRLALSFIHRVLLQAVRRYRAVEPRLNAKVLRSLRVVTRVALLFAAYLILAQALLGRGALYGIAREVALAGALAVAWWLIHAWRVEVTGAYLAFSPEGRLAAIVRASQDRSYGLLIAAAAFVYVAAFGLWVWLRDSALRFEQTRKALAYLFRRQLERQSKNLAAPSDPSLLPRELQATLTEEPVARELSIDVYPQLDTLEAQALALPGGGGGALVALAGERGAGKTSWMLELQRRLEGAVPCVLHSFDSRTPSVDALCLALSRSLGFEPSAQESVLIERLRGQAPCVVLLDLVQNMLLRAVGGHAGHDALVRIAQATTGSVLWVLAYARWPFEYVQRTQLGRDVYDRVIMLAPWSEAQIGALIDARMAAAGFSADYETLGLNDGLARPIRRAAPDAADIDERAADRYHRLVWDYANGNPRLALHFFRLSLVWTQGKEVAVRLFPMPSVDALEPFETQTWLTLACLVQHESLTIDEAAGSLRFARADCARALQLLHTHGFLSCNGEGRYRVASHWSRAVQRFLQRKKLLVA
ncbi:MAG: hypothetical protein WA210_13945, partial [Burkholderiaceae bacterium]